MSLLVVQNLDKAFGGDTILTNINFKLEWRQKLGLVGRNGSGKTTLLRMLTGQQEADKGAIQYMRGVRAGYLRQEDVVNPESTVLQEAEAAFQHVRDMENQLRAAEEAMAEAEGTELEKALEVYGDLHNRFEAMGGYDNLRDIPGVLKKLGFGPNDLNKPCGRLSGGEKTRLALARLLLSGPDILYLDEPTNHLDIEATEWLESFLKEFGGGIVLVSHDRYFLDRVVTSIAEIDNARLTLYTGNYTAFWQQKQANRVRQQELFEREQREVARLLEFFEKWKNTPTKKNQAWERYKWAQRIKQHGLSMDNSQAATARPDALGKKVKLGIKPTQTSGNEVVIFDHLSKKYGERTLFSGVKGLIQRGDRVGVVGPNGAGKSTLVKILLGRETPTEGMARLGASVTVGYFAQDTSDLDMEASVLENMLDVAEMSPTEARSHLGRFLFTGEDAFRQVQLLSGGEKNKLVLAQLTWLKPNLLVLDEPTNHLDLDSREALIQMIKEYEGTLLLISHDRYLLDQVTTRTLEVADGRARLYDAPYSEYRALKARVDALEPVVYENTPKNGSSKNPTLSGNTALETLLAQRPEPVASPAAGMNAHQLSKERQRAKNAVAAVEQKVTQIEARLAEIEAKLSNPSPGDNVVALSQEHGGVQGSLALAMEEWERAAAYAESL